MTRKPVIKVVAGLHMTTATRDDEPLATLWDADGKWFVAATGQHPQEFDEKDAATDCFLSALGLSGGA